MDSANERKEEIEDLLVEEDERQAEPYFYNRVAHIHALYVCMLNYTFYMCLHPPPPAPFPSHLQSLSLRTYILNFHYGIVFNKPVSWPCV